MIAGYLLMANEATQRLKIQLSNSISYRTYFIQEETSNHVIA